MILSMNALPVSRRCFLASTGAAATAFTFLPAAVLGRAGETAPNSRINVAFLGVGSQGMRVMLSFLKERDVQGVAVCDPVKSAADYHQWGQSEFASAVHSLLGVSSGWEWLSPNQPMLELTPTMRVPAGVCGREPAQKIVDAWNAKRSGATVSRGCAGYADYRDLLANVKDVDAVVIGSPDHLHAVLSVAAMKAGKHVFCQKPMTRTIQEARRVAAVAKETGVVTQVAVGPQASEDTRRLCEWVGAGAIGRVREVLNWSSRPFWPQGIPAPTEAQPIPAGLDWDLWLGPAAERPYHHAYLPFVWRGWVDFGCGAFGDMGCYSFDTIFRVLKLAPPVSAEASSTHRYPASYPQASLVNLDFAARGDQPPVKLRWFDGGLRPERPADLDPAEKLEAEGLMFVGDAGTILAEFVGSRPRLIPSGKMRGFQEPPKTLPRSPGNEREWLDAIQDRKRTTGANFGFSADVTEALCLANLALRSGERLGWDTSAMKVTGPAAAQEMVNPPARAGWSV
jgi:predicted dehydrogenase